jgi:hypothetical protein
MENMALTFAQSTLILDDKMARPFLLLIRKAKTFFWVHLGVGETQLGRWLLGFNLVARSLSYLPRSALHATPPAAPTHLQPRLLLYPADTGKLSVLSGQRMLHLQSIDVGFGAKVIIGNDDSTQSIYSRLLPSIDGRYGVFLSTKHQNLARIIVDLGALYPVDEIRLWKHPDSTDEEPLTLIVDTSLDQNVWKPLAVVFENFGSCLEGNPASIPSLDRSQFRYLRILRRGYGRLSLQYVEILMTPPTLNTGFLRDMQNTPSGITATYYSTHRWGMFSNVSTAMADILVAGRAGINISRIDFSAGMIGFKNIQDDNNYDRLFKRNDLEKDAMYNWEFDPYDVHKEYKRLPLVTGKFSICAVG